LTNQICFANIGYICKTKNSMKDNISSNFDNPYFTIQIFHIIECVCF